MLKSMLRVNSQLRRLYIFIILYYIIYIILVTPL